MKDRDREMMEQLATNILEAKQQGESAHAIMARLYRDLAPHTFKNERGFTQEERTKWGKELIYFCTRWVDCGLPHVVVDNRLAASMMMTDIPPDFAQHVRPPWPAFMLTIPANILGRSELSVCVDADWEESPERGDFTRVIFTDRYPSDDGHGSLPWNLQEHWSHFGSFDWDLMNAREGHKFSDKPQDRKRRLQVVLRLLFCASAELQNRAAEGTGPSRPSRAACKPGVPMLWSIRLSRPVKVDAREYVREYVSGERGSLRLKYMRRGHWRNQPHGPRSSLRKFIHIEPHLVGPGDAPFAVRPHVLSGSDDVPE